MLSHRRRMLLTLASFGSFHYESQHYDFLRNSLVPSLLNSYYVDDKVKRAKISKIYANGVIENQLANLNILSSLSGLTITKNEQTGEVTLNGTTNENRNNTYINAPSERISGHKYLYCLKVTNGSVDISNRTTTNLTYGFQIGANLNITYQHLSKGQMYAVITTESSSSSNAQFIRCGYDENVVFDNYTFITLVIDLTQRYGAGNEPTSLSDNRIQALLNRGNIDYNAGEYKSTDISEFVSEPYNLFDEEWESGSINSDGTYNANTTFARSKNYISVLGNVEYAWERGSLSISTTSARYLALYDSNKTFIERVSVGNLSQDIRTYTIPNNVRYVRLVYYILGYDFTNNLPTDTSFHRTSNRTGYAPHKTLSPSSFKYQGNGAINSHDTLEITSSEFVFTKNVNKYTFNGTEAFSIGGQITSGLYRYYHSKTDMSVGIAQDGTSDKYPTDKGTYNATTEQAIRFGQNNNALYFYLTGNYSTSAEVSAVVNGTTIVYPLATPQVIRIPRKHLAIVDLGSLEWQYSSSTQTFYVMNMDIANKGDTSIANICCSKYMTLSPNDIVNNNKQGIGYSTNYYLRVRDTTYTNATDFKNAMSGTYLFYETQDEVADIDNTMQIEVGGTISTDSFEWVENQLISNGDFADFSNWQTSGGSTIYSYSNNILTFKAVQQYGGIRQDLTITNGNKYLVAFSVKQGNINNSVRLTLTNFTNGTIIPSTNTDWQQCSAILTATSNTSVLYIRDFGSSNWVDNQITNVMCIDLTLAFGSGNEPTSIDDPRIQSILRKGYIPTNTTGTTKGSNVLLNADIEFGVKD